MLHIFGIKLKLYIFTSTSFHLFKLLFAKKYFLKKVLKELFCFKAYVMSDI